MEYDSIIKRNCLFVFEIIKDNCYFFILLLVCMLNIFYISSECTNRFFTSGMLWLGCVVPIMVIIYFLLFPRNFRIPKLGIYILGLFIAYILYSWRRGTFSVQYSFFLFVLYLLMVLFSNSRKELSFTKVCIVVNGVAIIEMLWGIAQRLGWCDTHSSLFPVTGSFDNPAGYAIYLAISIPFALYCVFNYSNYWRIIGFCIVSLLATGIILSDSRTGCVALVVVIFSSILYYPILKIRTWCWVIIGGIFLMFPLCYKLYHLKKDSADGRLLIWHCTWDMIRDKPLFGHGPGSFGGKYMVYQAAYLALHMQGHQSQLAGNVKHPFNEYLKVLTEYGLIGFIAMCIGVMWLVSTRITDNYEYKTIKMSFLAMAICALFSYPLKYPAICCFMAILIGLLMQQGKASYIGGKHVRLYGILLMISLLIFFMYWRKMEYCWHDTSYKAMVCDSDVLPVYKSMFPFMQENPLFLYNYGAILNKRKIWHESILKLEQSLKQLNDTDIQLLLAENYMEIGDYSHAESCLLLASQMCPKMFLPIYRLVELYRKIGQENKALYYARKILDKPVKIPSNTVKRIREEMHEFVKNKVEIKCVCK